jgi:hypothetical protein
MLMGASLRLCSTSSCEFLTSGGRARRTIFGGLENGISGEEPATMGSLLANKSEAPFPKETSIVGKGANGATPFCESFTVVGVWNGSPTDSIELVGKGEVRTLDEDVSILTSNGGVSVSETSFLSSAIGCSMPG